jgi:hypothetical protein
VPGYQRWVVMASQDGDDAWGCTDQAIGYFGGGGERLARAGAVIRAYWERRRSENESLPWCYLFDEGLVSKKMAESWRERVWTRSEEGHGQADHDVGFSRPSRLRKRDGGGRSSPARIQRVDAESLCSSLHAFQTASPAGVESTAESSDASPALRRFVNCSVSGWRVPEPLFVPTGSGGARRTTPAPGAGSSG